MTDQQVPAGEQPGTYQEAHAAGPAAQSEPGSGKGGDPYKIHDHAIEASKHLEAIATGLGHADAPEKVTATFTKMADACRQIASSMSRAPAPAPKGGGRETMDSATNDLAAAAQRPR